MYKQLQKQFSKAKLASRGYFVNRLNEMSIHKFTVMMQTLFLALVCIVLSSITMPAHGQDALGFSRIAEGGFWDDPPANTEYDPHNS
jgi:hypothetical protein